MTDRKQTVNCPNCKRLFSTPQGLGMHLRHGCSLSDKKSFVLGKQPDREKLCKEFTELTGGHWHEYKIRCGGGRSYLECSCGHCAFLGENEKQNPNYDNPADVLRVFDDIHKMSDFIFWLSNGEQYNRIHYTFIIEPDALLNAAVEFLKERIGNIYENHELLEEAMNKEFKLGDKVLNCNSVAVHRGWIGVVSAVRDNLVWAKYEDGQETYMKSFDYTLLSSRTP
jgi:hypothetical protein